MFSSRAKKILGVLVVVMFVAGWAYSKFRSIQTQLKEVDQVETHEKVLHLFAFSDYFPEAIIKKFEEKFHAKVQYDLYSNNEELLAKFQAGAKGYDVIVPSDYMIPAFVAGNYLAELDHSKLPNLKNLSIDFVKVPYEQDNKYSVPYTWGTTGIVYNTKFVKEKIESWKQLLDPKYKGHISVLDDQRETLGAMLHALGYPSNTTDLKQLKEAGAMLVKLKPSIRLFSTDPKQQLLSEDIWIAHIYSGDAYQVIKQKPQIKYVVPKEGATLWIDNMAIPRSARDPELAHAFINFILDPAVNAAITEELGYASPNLAAAEKIPDTSLRATQIKKLGMSHLEFIKDLGSFTENYDQTWNEAKTH